MITNQFHRSKVALLAASILLLAGCSSADEVSLDGRVFELDREVPESIALVDADRTNVVPAPLLRSLLQDLLTEHSDLSIEAMRIAADGDDVTDVVDRLTVNTDALTTAIGLVYGPTGARAFDELWTSHIEFFYDYAAATAAGDEAAAAQVTDELGHYENDFSSFIDVATSGAADFHDVLHVLHSHVDQLLRQADAWASGDFDEAFSLSSEAHSHMDVIAAALAAGISIQQPEAFPGDSASDAAMQCAQWQLEGSLLLAARADAERAAMSDEAARRSAAAAMVNEIADASDPSVVAVVDEQDPDESVSVRRATIRSRIIEDFDCAGFVVG